MIKEANFVNKEIFECSMLIGNRFKQTVMKNEETRDWTGTGECAAFTRLMYEMLQNLNMSMEMAFDVAMSIVEKNGFKPNLPDYGYDDFARGFLAGEVFGKPTEENMRKVKIAEEKWHSDNGTKYGYYQEVLNEVNSDESLQNLFNMIEEEDRWEKANEES